MNKTRNGSFWAKLITVVIVSLLVVGMIVATLVSVIDVRRITRLQESEQQALESRLEELMAQLDGDGPTLADFENMLAEKLSEVDLSLSDAENQAAITAAVTAALEEYGAAKCSGSTGLSEEQLEQIVNRTLAGSLTEAQVESIVRKYASDNLTASQIRRLVEQAIENSLTAGAIRQAVDDALNSNATLSEIDAIAAAVQDIQKNALTKHAGRSGGA